jgi:hypothetical protein
MRLSDCFMEIIAYTTFVARRPGAPLSYEQVRKHAAPDRPKRSVPGNR